MPEINPLSNRPVAPPAPPPAGPSGPQDQVVSGGGLDPTLTAVKQLAAKTVTQPDGLKYTDTTVGTGPSPKPGDTVTVNYVGKLADGTVFDASANHGQPFSFVIGEGNVIKGWDEGVMSMQRGGKRTLEIPPNLAYGSAGIPGVIPPNATLTFDVELLNTSSS